MSAGITEVLRTRKSFAKIDKIIDIPNLIEVQIESYASFLQKNIKPEARQAIGLQKVFASVFPISDFSGTASLEFVSYSFDAPKYDVNECKERGMTYSAPIRVVVRLVIWDVDEITGAKSIRDIKEQEIYFGEIPLMTDEGTFVINGTERVVVSQLQRSPGVFFDHDQGKTHSSGKVLYFGRVIPYRGSWLDFEFDHKDILYVRIDKRRKIPATILLKALGFSEKELLNYFYKSEHIKIKDKTFFVSTDPDLLSGQKNPYNIKHPTTGEILLKKDRKFTKFSLKKLLQAKIKEIQITEENIIGGIASNDITNPKTGDVIVRCNEEITFEKLEEIQKAGLKEFDMLYIDNFNIDASLRETLLIDKVKNHEEALLEIYKRMRPGDPPSVDSATTYFNNLFFNPVRYDLSRVGRLKINFKFNFNDIPLDYQTLRKEDILEVVRYLIDLKNGTKEVDDIDHLGNRRVRSVGELVENQYRIGLVRMERAIKERMSLQEVETLMPHELVNAKPVSAVLKEFFGSGQLSQFMDQTNPLSEVTHKRRLSALGPGGMTRDRAGFEVRDVHPTHYGRMCPIETPEGPNIGLIASLSTFAKVDEFGFIETPYRKVDNGIASKDVEYLSALEEERYIIAQANAPLDPKGKFINKSVSARKGGEFVIVGPAEVNYMDVSPNQLVSVAASLIPFLENDDANRALMGSNMQRQAVPLLKPVAPIVGTGIEGKVAQDSGVTILAKAAGVIDSVDATRIVIKRDEKTDGHDIDIYNLTKYKKSNQSTCLNQRPIVDLGDKVVKGQVLADGSSTSLGELSLGQNVVVAIMPWGGYNFEDSILVSEKLVKDDIYTSVHIEEFECVARDTKLGKEEITRDIPNVNEEALANLDEAGIIRIGALVKPGDIVVGKITPKGETQLSPEEKLLRAIFGEKAGDVKDTSLRVTPGVTGTIIGARVFSREGVDKDDRTKKEDDEMMARLLKDQQDEIKVIRDNTYQKIRKVLLGKTTAAPLTDSSGNKKLIAKNTKLTASILDAIDPQLYTDISLKSGESVEREINTILITMNEQVDMVKMIFSEKIDRIKRGDELPPGVVKMVKVYIATKRKLNVGDKMAGRHGNKGVVSKILPEEDMPYMEDGTSVDIVLNPLGVPSRMNVGQILEAHLGWAAKGIAAKLNLLLNEKEGVTSLRNHIAQLYGDNTHIKKLLHSLSQEEVYVLARKLAKRGVFLDTPVFDGAREDDIKDMFKEAGFPSRGQLILFDGRMGTKFANNVTVGVMYILKLHHLVEDKIHARSIGPYSLVTQQPLGGKAQFGGQRLGEMEVWALEAYGAAYALQEFLTVKSDDIYGRTRTYEAIVKGETDVTIGLPESFNVLIKELKGLGLNVEMLKKDEKVH